MTRPVESKVTRLSNPKTLEHGLPPYLASDEALIHMLNRYPADLFDANGQVSLPVDEEGRPEAETLLHDIRTGRLQVTLRNVEHAHPGLWAEAVASFQKLAPELGIRSPGKLTGQLILSSANACAPYDFDAVGSVFFHLRGVKRVWVYPINDVFLPQATMENVISGKGEGLSHCRLQDGSAWRFDLVPGEALAWPLYSPHRVENQEGICVTLVVDFKTWESRFTAGAHLANSVLRRRGRKIASMDKTPMIARALLWAGSHVFALLGLVKPRAGRIVREYSTSDIPVTIVANDNRQAA